VVARLGLSAALLAFLAGCASELPSLCAGLPGEAGITAQLFFGRTSASASIGDAEWQDFLATSVTPRFPAGLTVLEAHGQWRQRGTGRVISEPSTIIEIATDRSAGTLARLDAIRADYRAKFHQESVGLVVAASCASF